MHTPDYLLSMCRHFWHKFWQERYFPFNVYFTNKLQIVNWLHCAFKLIWNYDKNFNDISLPDYIPQVLNRFQHEPPPSPPSQSLHNYVLRLIRTNMSHHLRKKNWLNKSLVVFYATHVQLTALFLWHSTQFLNHKQILQNTLYFIANSFFITLLLTPIWAWNCTHLTWSCMWILTRRISLFPIQKVAWLNSFNLSNTTSPKQYVLMTPSWLNKKNLKHGVLQKAKVLLHFIMQIFLPNQ